MPPFDIGRCEPAAVLRLLAARFGVSGAKAVFLATVLKYRHLFSPSCDERFARSRLMEDTGSATKLIESHVWFEWLLCAQPQRFELFRWKS